MVRRGNIKLIVIGGSYGALEAMREILANLSKEWSLPLIFVFHRNRDSQSADIVEYFSNSTNLRVKEIDDHEEIRSGYFYFAPGGYHLLLESRNKFILYYDDELNYSRPSIDLFFESASDIFGAELLGILLSGANRDGASGLCSIKKRGGVTIVQEPESALAATMPEGAIEICKPDLIKTTVEIAAALTTYYGENQKL